ncbi:glycoside hydrolase family 20 zincin-like fold domain-containing protein [Actinokineospora auranticolor]|uniref:Glycosyl hydrolase family 20 n=1 Tax=Actinokineospora auranticolor TaxID=155976 RepID=A0A2S6GF20_9PSEU|nr:glycoside hydrolase family 20 zincin-like fold domain-containing protein [Actinokineospora auranticolor]PPK63825.1 glycosyl hydrolase family 20 [Actinokineospora auranticolor]
MRTHALLAGVAVLFPLLAVPANAGDSLPPPEVWPLPHQITRSGADVVLPASALVVVDAGTDQSTRDGVEDVLGDGGVGTVEVVEYGHEHASPLKVRVGALSGANIHAAAVTLPASLPAEGYYLTARPGEIVLAGADADGTFHATQTFWQLMQPGKIAPVTVTDYPSFPVRGVVEGSYRPQ